MKNRANESLYSTLQTSGVRMKKEDTGGMGGNEKRPPRETAKEPITHCRFVKRQHCLADLKRTPRQE
jgi:hypothetical protein